MKLGGESRKCVTDMGSLGPVQEVLSSPSPFCWMGEQTWVTAGLTEHCCQSGFTEAISPASQLREIRTSYS